MSDWRFEGCVLRHANLAGATLDNAAFLGCRGPFANFTAARLTDALFRSSDFNNGIFIGASLSQAS
ncbi:pentapeptide repeat-containing protein, partial [Klebsiella pneumoniae]|uniref:pentapeptide repeat-containing protein n=1 Tax=Klebsiella pneumoniae TaxID=573 RepID=UPI001953512A